MADFHSYSPAEGHGLPHNPFKAIVAPRPIGWIGSISKAGEVNLAPYSFFNAVSERPPIVMFSSNGWKDSTENISETGVFTCSLATRALAENMNLTSGEYAHGISEFGKAALTARASDLIAAPFVAASPAAFECRLIEIKHLRDAEGRETSNHLVFGEVVRVHIDKAFLRGGLFDTAAAEALARCGYHDYAVVTEVFSMRRPGPV